MCTRGGMCNCDMKKQFDGELNVSVDKKYYCGCKNYSRSTTGVTNLMRSILVDDMNGIKLWCTKKTVNDKSDDEISVLNVACMYGNIDTIKLLLEYKVNVKDEKNIEVLLQPCRHDIQTKIEIINILIEHDAPITGILCFSNSINLYQGASDNKPLIEIMKYFLNVNNDIINMSINEDLDTCLIHICDKLCDRFNEIDDEGKELYKNYITFLIEKGASVDTANERNHTPLFHLSSKGDELMEIAEMMIKKGASVNVHDRNSTILRNACVNNTTTKFIELLLNNKVNVNFGAFSTSPSWALGASCAKGKFEVIKLLVDNKAIINGNIVTSIIYKQNKNKYIDTNYTNILKILLDNKMNVNVVDEYGVSPLMLACTLKNRNEQFKLLVDYGADINFHKQSLYMFALMSRDTYIIETVEKNINVTDLNSIFFINFMGDLVDYQNCISEGTCRLVSNFNVEDKKQNYENIVDIFIGRLDKYDKNLKYTLFAEFVDYIVKKRAYGYKKILEEIIKITKRHNIAISIESGINI